MALYIAAIIFAVAGRNQPGSLPNIIAYIFLILIILYAFATILPSLAIQVRRLRDAGYHWAYIFLHLGLGIGGIVLLILFCQPTKVEYPFNNFNNPQQ
jgi:membrane protein